MSDQLCVVIVLWISDGDNLEIRACATQGLRKREGVRGGREEGGERIEEAKEERRREERGDMSEERSPGERREDRRGRREERGERRYDR